MIRSLVGSEKCIRDRYLIEASQQHLERFENHQKYNRLAEALIKFQDDEEENDIPKTLFYDSNDEHKGCHSYTSDAADD